MAMLARIQPLKQLVNEMLDQLPKSVWRSKTTTFLDPAIGGGQFVAEIERRLRAAGHNDENIKSRVFGFEYSLALIDIAINMNKLVGTYKKMLYEDFFKWDTDMKFDVIIGNPPYQSEKGTGTQPLWPLFVHAAYNMLSADGYMAMITPNKWCGHTANVIKGGVHLYADIFKGKMVECNIQECSKYFPKVGGYANCFSYFIINNSGADSFEAVTLDGTYTVSKDQFTSLPLIKLTKLTSSILTKVNTDESYNFSQVSSGFTNTNEGAVVISMAQRLHYEKLNIYYDKNTSVTATSKSTVSKKKFSKSSQKKVDAVFRSKLFKFIHMIYWNNDNFGTNFYNSLPFLDLNLLWTDETIYDHFKFTNAERNYIDKCVEVNVK